jgi:hypothetical protein
MFTFELISILPEGYLNIFTFSGFLKILKFLDCLRRLSLRRQFFCAGSACVSNFFAQTQPA